MLMVLKGARDEFTRIKYLHGFENKENVRLCMFKKIKNMSKKQKKWEVLLFVAYLIFFCLLIYAAHNSYTDILKESGMEQFKIPLQSKHVIVLVAVFCIGFILCRYLVYGILDVYRSIRNINNTDELKIYKQLEIGIFKSKYIELNFWCIGAIYLILAIYLISEFYYILVISIIPIGIIIYLMKKEKICERSYQDNFKEVLENYFNNNPELCDDKRQIEFLKSLKFDVQVRYFNYTEILMDSFKIWATITGFLFTISMIKIDFQSTILSKNIFETIYIGVIIFIISFLFAMLNHIYNILVDRKVMILGDVDKYIDNLQEKEKEKEKQNLKEIENIVSEVFENKYKELELEKEKQQNKVNKITKRRNRR